MKTTIKQTGTDRNGRAKWEAQRAKDKHNIISVLAVDKCVPKWRGQGGQ